MAKGDKIYFKALSEANKADGDLNYVFGLLQKAAALNNPKAKYALGTWYLHGKFVKKNYKKAVEYLSEAADENIKDALYDLAVCYEKGAGTKKDIFKAFQLYLKASLLGEKQSLYEVGRCYYYGLGVEKNVEIAKIWLDQAKENEIC